MGFVGPAAVGSVIGWWLHAARRGRPSRAFGLLIATTALVANAEIIWLSGPIGVPALSVAGAVGFVAAELWRRRLLHRRDTRTGGTM